ncbi:hypothetical protein MtrunA17_Chr5g0403041 [Medicago truncatula]|uniref:Uncharacterized protein n=1 Tax=Medicago truncatula TaxID=3880 RepID=A0A396HL81_MEDTR|nr:hypothetical protein MtrunA17_Chr5g0403041 [Medicago truncatula]
MLFSTNICEICVAKQQQPHQDCRCLSHCKAAKTSLPKTNNIET